MTNLKLKPRLQEICNLIEPSSNVIDVGADHALLDIYLNKYKNCNCLAIDISAQCLKRAEENLKKYDADVKLKINNGLENIELNNEIIVISGMGTRLIKQILNREIKNDLIIVTHTDIDELIDFLTNKKYEIYLKKDIFDKRKYTIIYFKYQKTTEM